MLKIEHARKKGKGGAMVIDYGFVIVEETGRVDGVTLSKQWPGLYVSREDAQVAIMRRGK